MKRFIMRYIFACIVYIGIVAWKTFEKGFDKFDIWNFLTIVVTLWLPINRTVGGMLFTTCIDKAISLRLSIHHMIRALLRHPDEIAQQNSQFDEHWRFNVMETFKSELADGELSREELEVKSFHFRTC